MYNMASHVCLTRGCYRSVVLNRIHLYSIRMLLKCITYVQRGRYRVTACAQHGHMTLLRRNDFTEESQACLTTHIGGTLP